MGICGDEDQWKICGDEDQWKICEESCYSNRHERKINLTKTEGRNTQYTLHHINNGSNIPC